MPVSPESEIGIAYTQGRTAADALALPTTNPYSDATVLGKQQRAAWFQGYYDAIRDQNIRILQSGLAFIVGAGFILPPGAPISFGSGGGSISQEPGSNPDQTGLWTGPTSNAFLIAEEADKAFDFAHPAQVDPTLFVHSHNQNTTQWLGLTHDGVNGVISVGAGDLKLAPTGTVIAKDGSAGDVAYGFNTDGDDTGFWLNGSGNLCASTVNSARFQLNGSALRMQFGLQVNWSSGDPTSVGADAGFARQAIGVVRTTDGAAGIRGFQGGGAAVASAAALPLPTGRVFHVTGAVNITSITSTNFQAGVVITLIFDGVLTLTDGGNLKLAGNFVTSVDATISLVYDGVSWYELGRSVN